MANLPDRHLRTLLLTAFVITCIFGPACQKKTLPGSGKIENVRFEPKDWSVQVHPTNIWLKPGQEVGVFWDKIEFAVGEDSSCDLCDPTCAFLPFRPENLRVVEAGSFVECEDCKGEFSFSGTEFPTNLYNACGRGSEKLNFFEPEQNGVYTLLPKFEFPFEVSGPTNGEVRINIIEDSVRVAFPLKYFQSTDNGAKSYWKWKAFDDVSWSDYFSDEFIVGRIRIFKAACANDVSDGDPCAIPMNADLVKPALVLFLPDDFGNPVRDLVRDFTGENLLRCFATPDAVDGAYIDLAACKTGTDRVPDSIERNPVRVPDAADKAIRWIVDLSTDEVSDAHVGDPAAEYIIEFEVKEK